MIFLNALINLDLPVIGAILNFFSSTFYFIIYLLTFFIPSAFLVVLDLIFSSILKNLFPATLLFLKNYKKLSIIIITSISSIFLILILGRIFLFLFLKSSKESLLKFKSTIQSSFISIVLLLSFPFFFLLMFEIGSILINIFIPKNTSLTLSFFNLAFTNYIAESSWNKLSKLILENNFLNIYHLIFSIVPELIFEKDPISNTWIFTFLKYNPILSLFVCASGAWVLGVSLYYLFLRFFKLIINYLYAPIPIFRFPFDGGISFKIWFYSTINAFLGVFSVLISISTFLLILKFFLSNPFKINIFNFTFVKAVLIFFFCLIYEKEILIKISNFLLISFNNAENLNFKTDSNKSISNKIQNLLVPTKQYLPLNNKISKIFSKSLSKNK